MRNKQPLSQLDCTFLVSSLILCRRRLEEAFSECKKSQRHSLPRQQQKMYANPEASFWFFRFLRMTIWREMKEWIEEATAVIIITTQSLKGFVGYRYNKHLPSNARWVFWERCHYWVEGWPQSRRKIASKRLGDILLKGVIVLTRSNVGLGSTKMRGSWNIL